jgi:hypothetical protein
MNVLIIPECYSKDQFILKPLIKAMLTHIGKPKAVVEVLKDPFLHSVNQAMNPATIKGIIHRYRGMVDLFILCVDRDGDPNRKAALCDRENEARLIGSTLAAENAWEEIETWLLAGVQLPKDWTWKTVRSEVHVKERFYLPYVKERGLELDPAQGRKSLGEEAARNYKRVRQLCKEDISNLENNIRLYLSRSDA